MMTILAKIGFAGKNLFLPAKTIFASPVFTAGKPVFPPSGKNLPTLLPVPIQHGTVKKSFVWATER